jgi:hypothetical protein
MSIIDIYFSAESKIYDFFKNQPDFTISPLNDCRNYYWMIVDDIIVFNEKEFFIEDFNSDGGKFYSGTIITGEDFYFIDNYVLIHMDAEQDGIGCLNVFNPSLEYKGDDLEKMKELYINYWK